MRTTTTWSGQITAISSIAHGGERRGTISLLRREMVRLPDGRLRQVPLVSGNSFRGSLRRVAADLFIDALDLEGAVSLVAAQLLRAGGGALHKSSKAPLTGERLRVLRELVPPVAAFGGTTNRTLGGALMVGKVIPQVAETEHLTGVVGPAMFGATTLETYTRVEQDLALAAGAAAPLVEGGLVDVAKVGSGSAVGPMLYRLETFPAGSVFSSWVRLERATPLLSVFVSEVLEQWSLRGRLGGRRGTGHGCISASWEAVSVPGPAAVCDWRAQLVPQRAAVLAVLGELS